MNVIVLDTECTDLKNHKVCEIGYALCQEGSNRLVVHHYVQALINPECHITVGASEVHDITDEMVVNKRPFHQLEVAMDLVHEVNKCSVLVGHNLMYDLIGLTNSSGTDFTKVDYVDTLKILHYLFGESGELNSKGFERYKLNYVRHFLKLPVDLDRGAAHSALSDVKITLALVNWLMAESGLTIKEMVEISKKPIIWSTFQFGKYKGKPLEDVLATDKKYLLWLFDQELKKYTEAELEDFAKYGNNVILNTLNYWLSK